jgi:hypothetical protein
MRVDGRPIFIIYRAHKIPGLTSFIREWQDLALETGLPGIYFIAHLFHNETDWDYTSPGFDSALVNNTLKPFSRTLREVFSDKAAGLYKIDAEGEVRHWLWRRRRALAGKFSDVRLYRHALPFLLDGCAGHPDRHPCIIPNWDNTPRSGTQGIVLHDSTPELFRIHLRETLDLVQARPLDQRLVFVKSWNEWAEGNYLEPDRRFGSDYLKVFREQVLQPQAAPALSV